MKEGIKRRKKELTTIEIIMTNQKIKGEKKNEDLKQKG